MTVEGWDSARDVGGRSPPVKGELPYLTQVGRILFADAPAASLLDCLETEV